LPHSEVGKSSLAVFFKQDSIECYKTNRIKLSAVTAMQTQANLAS